MTSLKAKVDAMRTAIRSGNHDRLEEWLVRLPPKIQADKMVVNLLFDAIEVNDSKALDVICRSGIHPDQGESTFRTPMAVAFREGKIEAGKTLYRHGARMTPGVSANGRVLIKYSQLSDLAAIDTPEATELLREVIRRGDHRTDSRKYQMNVSPLFSSARGGAMANLDLLLENQVDTDSEKLLGSAMLAAVHTGQTRIFDRLISYSGGRFPRVWIDDMDDTPINDLNHPLPRDLFKSARIAIESRDCLNEDLIRAVESATDIKLSRLETDGRSLLNYCVIPDAVNSAKALIRCGAKTTFPDGTSLKDAAREQGASRIMEALEVEENEQALLSREPVAARPGISGNAPGAI